MRSSQIAIYMFRSEQDYFVDLMCKKYNLYSVFMVKGKLTIDNGRFIGKRTVRYVVQEGSVGSVQSIGEEGIAIDTSLSPVVEIQRSTIERVNGDIYLRRGRLYASFNYYKNGTIHNKDFGLYKLYKIIKSDLIRSSSKYNIDGSIVYASELSVKLIQKRNIKLL